MHIGMSATFFLDIYIESLIFMHPTVRVRIFDSN